MRLAYQAFDKTGRAISDTVEAATLDDARDSLRRQGLFITNIVRAGSEQGGNASAAGPRRRLSGGKRLKHVALFTRQLYVLLSTGTPMTDALSALERQTRDPRWKAVVSDLKSQVERGKALSEAMNEHPHAFDAIYRSLISAAEHGGKFEPILDRLSMLTKKQMQTRNQLAAALVYPALLLTVSAGVLVAMLTFVLPRFTTLFTTLNLPLPPTTKALVIVSDVLTGYWWAILPSLAVGVFGLVQWLRTESGRLAMDTAMIRVPIVRDVTRGVITARIIRLLGVLGDSYVPLLDALALAKETAGNSHYRNLVAAAQDAVTRGEPISSAFNDERLISPTVYEAMRSGEQTGKVSALLLNMADFLDEENEVLLKTMTGLLEPIILIALGVVVGFVAVSMFLPLFDLTAQAGGG